MSNHQRMGPDPTTYFLDANSPAELARLINQANMAARTIGWLFPPGVDSVRFQSVLDVACGPGNWVLDVAFHHPPLEAVGVDINHQMIAYARARAQSQSLPNALFAHGDVMGTLYDEAESFDFVNARFLVGLMRPQDWPVLLAECHRLLRPGGILCLTEGEWALTNSPAYQKYARFISQSLFDAAQSFSADGFDLAITPVLGPLLRKAGFQNNDLQSHVLDISYGQEGHMNWLEDCRILFDLAKPFILRYLPMTQHDLDACSVQALTEMQQETFCGIGYALSIWGTKSAQVSSRER